MALSRSSVLHYWSSRFGINPVVGGRPVFTRSSAGLFTAQGGEVSTAIVNTPRFDWATLNLPNSQTERRKVLTLELARTNLNLLALSAWTPDGASITDSQPDPAGGTAAVKLTWTGGNGRTYNGVTFTGDGTKAMALAICAGTSAQSIFRVVDTTTSATRIGVNVAWSGGVPTPSIGVGGGTIFPVQPLGGGFYLLAFAANGVVAADGNRGEIVPDTSNTSKFIYAYRPSIENGPFATSLMDPSSSRAADSCYWNFPPVPQAMMAYVRFVEQGSITVNGGRVLQIGAAGDTNARLYVVCDGTNYLTAHDTGTGVTSVLAVAPAVGDTVEILSILFSDGSVQIIQSVNGAAVSAAAQSGVKTLAGGWSDTRLWLNSVGATAIGANKFAEVKIVKYADVVGATAQTRMDELRAFELGPNSEVL